MAKKNLQAQIDELKALLAERGIRLPVEEAIRPEERGDYVGFRSPEYRDFLGLVEVDDVSKAEADDYIVHTSPDTDKSYRLEDQVTPFMHYPDPLQIAKLVLMQKISSFESGPPPAVQSGDKTKPNYAPPMWEPVDLVIA